MSGLGLLVRGMNRVEVIALALVTMASVLVLAVPQRTIAAAGVDSLEMALAEAPPSVAGIAVRTPVETLGLRDLEAAMTLASEVEGDVLVEVVGDLAEPHRLAETVTFSVLAVNGEDPVFPSYVTLRYQPEAEALATTVDGGPAGPEAEPIVIDGEPSEIPVVDFALSVESVTSYGLSVGDVLLVTRAPRHPSAAYLASTFEPIYLRLVEVVELPDDTNRMWFDDDSLIRPLVVDTSLGADFYLTGLLRQSQFEDVASHAQTRGLAVEGRYLLSTTELSLAEADDLERAVKRLDNATREVPTVRGDPGVRSGLAVVLGQESDRRRAAAGVADTVTAAVLGLIAVESFVLGSAAATRRRNRMAVSRGRGADTVQLIGSVTLSAAAVVAATAAAVAWALGLWWSPSQRWWSEAVPAAAAVLIGVVVGASRDAVRPLGVLLGRAPDTSLRFRRAFDISLVALAVMSVISGRAGGVAGRLAPVLIGLVVGRLVERVTRVGAGLAGRLSTGSVAEIGRWAGTRRRGPTPLVAPAVVALTVGGLTWSMLAGIDQAIDTASWQRLAAPVAIDVPVTTDPQALAEFGATGISFTDVRLQTPEFTTEVELILIDPRAFARVLLDTPVDPRLPGSMLDGGAAGPIPIVLSSDYGPEPQSIGTVLTSLLAPRDIEFEVAAIASTFPGVTPGTTFAVASAARYGEAVGFVPRPGRYIVGSDSTGLRSTVEGLGGEVVSRLDVVDEIRSVPLNAGVIDSVRLAAAVTAGLGMAGLVAGLMVEAGRLRRHIATLEALGADRRQRRAIVRSETAPALAGVAVGGVAAWAVTLTAVGGSIDLGPFAATAASLQVDTRVLLSVSIAWSVLMLVVVAVFSRVIDRTDVGTVLRAEAT